jgi:hypothetical protein
MDRRLTYGFPTLEKIGTVVKSRNLREGLAQVLLTQELKSRRFAGIALNIYQRVR